MKKIYPCIIAVLLSLTSLSGCQVIGDIFKAGVWVGIIVVVVIVGIVAMIISKARK